MMSEGRGRGERRRKGRREEEGIEESWASKGHAVCDHRCGLPCALPPFCGVPGHAWRDRARMGASVEAVEPFPTSREERESIERVLF